jgi:hypothetical protein
VRVRNAGDRRAARGVGRCPTRVPLEHLTP